jgi:hypothetical protein
MSIAIEQQARFEMDMMHGSFRMDVRLGARRAIHVVFHSIRVLYQLKHLARRDIELQ